MLDWDHSLFRRINRTWTHESFDAFFVYVTDLFKQPSFVYGLFLPVVAFCLFKYRMHALRIVLTAVALQVVANFLSGEILKPLFARPRPEHVIDGVRLIAGGYGGFSLPSSHAMNAFAVLVYLGLTIRRMLIPSIALAACIAYSRVYLGYHFPSDVVFGALLGTLVALLVHRKTEKKV